jgi:hypothetical protein
LVNDDNDECRRSEMTESHLDRHKDSAEDQERAQDEIESALGERDSVWPI